MIHLRQTVFGVVAAATLALALPAMAEDATPAAPAPAMKAATPAPAMKTATKKGAIDPVETQIANLHKQLSITSAQEEAFNAVAQVMRDNRTAHGDLVTGKRQNEATMTAVEDLQAYAEVAQSHADGVKKLATTFGTLYASLSDAQKKAADEAFRQHKRRMMHHTAHHAMNMHHAMQKPQ